ncbi:hypothetical protein SB394_30620 [Burkholderia sp. BCCIQ04A]|uniref:PIN domain-containing protein n=2 Tax=Burkholderia TaxID=32008 RepID=B1FDV0_9BURK|nr:MULTISPECIES: hypothetical protein [Burkholderia]MEB2505229.1 hypothetical protein [Burkholderia anthinoferrum]MEB2534504.1 hypothetical protein [Burkholderia anthinoferrum]MEB2562518.1 hypothetical protein [Burkholderia anthinoferrum]MEB2581443.1 hypothetical protein [Burkholderia anthinoferrum]EDT04240.1 hypothetical protein BamIOP4010DRAFT_2209 [Burkholderia ambifaria IOP40-10]
MIQIILDTNIYDCIEQDAESAELLLNLIEQQAVAILMPRQVAEELHRREAGFPDQFPVEIIGHAVARVGIMRAGDHLGSGEIYDAHRGTSNSEADAFIVDVAAMVADWFISEDRRSLRRFPAGTRCIPMRYGDFCEKLRSLVEEDDLAR